MINTVTRPIITCNVCSAYFDVYPKVVNSVTLRLLAAADGWRYATGTKPNPRGTKLGAHKTVRATADVCPKCQIPVGLST